MIEIMKKIIAAITAFLVLATSCGTQNLLGGTNNGSSSGGGLGDILSGVLGVLTSQNTLSGLLNLVIGSVKLDERELYGTWSYAAPACAFTSENLLAKAGGAVAAENVNEKLLTAYSQLGINSNNTTLTFTEDGRFSGKIDGLPLSGTYTYDQSNCAIKMQVLGGLLNLTSYVTRSKNGIGLTFESKKLLSLLQTVAKLSGNSTLETIGDLSTKFDGIRVGFDLKK